MANIIEFKEVGLRYGDKSVVSQLNFSIQEGEIFVLVGPSGGGKTSTLKMINALVVPTDGDVYFADKKIKDYDLQNLRLKIGYVLQQIALFPNMTVQQNIELIPELRGWDKVKRHERCDYLLNKVGLDAEKYKGRYPNELSGGEQQRIGILRAIAAEPDLILMDEPFSALDPISRTSLQDLILNIHDELGTTIVFVTHDMNEALKVGSRIAVVTDGSIVQLDTPEAIKNNPASEFVKSFFGAAHFSKNKTLRDVLDQIVLVSTDKPAETILSVLTELSEVYDALIRADKLAIFDENNQFLGNLTKEKIFEFLSVSQ
ncbi:ATP-binding cassette domain-containing protein [Lactococcus hircilactis]|uniref:ABC-type quaternary amine transporter n=1 Tax=Lactococcus hircilactis TaxID=1494462 RepID=A0A7X1Z804_9LACT|nr:ABC transporter ATP-binding protein [Lactococcus hircilactis]MQW38417.1 ATP-binding cassette domain-containing protein [Lactococcus hircilactis]